MCLLVPVMTDAPRGIFGQMIRDLRFRKGWSHDKLARASGLSKGGIIKIEEYDEPKMREVGLASLARALDMSPEELMAEYERRRDLAGQGMVEIQFDERTVVRLEEGAKKKDMSVSDYLGYLMTLAEMYPELADRAAKNIKDDLPIEPEPHLSNIHAISQQLRQVTGPDEKAVETRRQLLGQAAKHHRDHGGS